MRTTLPSAAITDLRRLKEKLDVLPDIHRRWLMLRLEGGPFAIEGEKPYTFISVDDKINAARALGKDALLHYLRTGEQAGVIPVDRDSELVNRESVDLVSRTADLRNFLRDHAAAVFEKQDGRALLELELYTAAVDVDLGLLREAVSQAQARVQGIDESKLTLAMASLACFGNTNDLKEVIDWLYQQPSPSSGSGFRSYYVFLSELKRRAPKTWRDIVKAIVMHEGFENVQPDDVATLVSLVEHFSGEHLNIEDRDHDSGKEAARESLRERFGADLVKIPVLSSSNRLLAGPKWKTKVDLAFDEMGHTFALNPTGQELAIVVEGRQTQVHRLRTSDGSNVGSNQVPFDDPNIVYVDQPPSELPPTRSFPTNRRTMWLEGLSITDRKVLTSPIGGGFALDEEEHRSWFDSALNKNRWTVPMRSRLGSAAAISWDAKYFVANDGFLNTIAVIDVSTGEKLSELSDHSSTPTRFRFSRDSKKLISVGEDNRIIIWDITNQKAICKYHGSNVKWGPVEFTADGKSFYARDTKGRLTAYALKTGEPRYAVPSDRFSVRAAISSADSKFLYVVTEFSTQSPCFVECWQIP